MVANCAAFCKRDRIPATYFFSAVTSSPVRYRQQPGFRSPSRSGPSATRTSRVTSIPAMAHIRRT